MSQLSRGEIWFVNLNPARGHEQAGIRPALIVSVNIFNQGPAGCGATYHDQRQKDTLTSYGSVI